MKKKKTELNRIDGTDVADRVTRTAVSGDEGDDGRRDEVCGPVSPEEVEASLLSGISLEVRVELGRTRMPLREALRLASGSVVDLERVVDEPVDLYVNDLLVARGEIVVVNDNFCVRITEVTPAAAEVSP